MESCHDQSPISTLKVDFQCSNCSRNVKKKLQGFSGVESISIDPKQGLVTVLGKVNPMVLVKLIQKMGQRAELWSFQKAPAQAQSHRRTRTRYCCHHENHSDFETDTDSSDEDEDTIYREHPQCKAMNGKRSKKNKGWKERLGFSNHFVKPKSWIISPRRRPANFPAPPPIASFSPCMRFYRSSTPPIYAAVSPYGRSSNLMHGFINPMINYRSYADNYRFTI